MSERGERKRSATLTQVLKSSSYGQAVPPLPHPPPLTLPPYLHVLRGEGIDSCSVLFMITTTVEYKSAEATRGQVSAEQERTISSARFNCGVELSMFLPCYRSFLRKYNGPNLNLLTKIVFLIEIMVFIFKVNRFFLT